MKSLHLALPRPAIYRTLTGSEIGRRIVLISSFALVKASSGTEVTSVSRSDIAPVPEARKGGGEDQKGEDRKRGGEDRKRGGDIAIFTSRGGIDNVEEKIEKAKHLSLSRRVWGKNDFVRHLTRGCSLQVIYKCRFFAFLAVAGSLMGSIICFIKGCTYVINSFREYFVSGGKAILMLVEAIDVYLVGTVMLVFGMGLYELFISNLDIAKMSSHGSNLLGLFKLMERPRWLGIQSINELKTKLGHVIVMVLLVGMFEKSKKVTISTPTDLLYFAASILLSSGCLYLLSKLQSTKRS